MNNKMTLEIAIEDAQIELVQFINNLCNKYNLSFFLLEIITKKIYDEILSKKEIDMKNLRDKYNSKIQEENNKKNEENEGISE